MNEFVASKEELNELFVYFEAFLEKGFKRELLERFLKGFKREFGKIDAREIPAYADYLKESETKIQKKQEKKWAKDILNTIVTIDGALDGKRLIKVLDVGCGPTCNIIEHLCIMAEQMGIKLEIYAIDKLPEVVAIAKEKLINSNLPINVQVAEAANLSIFEDNFFDVVIAMQIFFSLDLVELIAFFKEVFRVSKNRGNIILRGHNRNFVFKALAGPMTRGAPKIGVKNKKIKYSKASLKYTFNIKEILFLLRNSNSGLYNITTTVKKEVLGLLWVIKGKIIK